MNKNNIKNVRFELIVSSLKGHKAIQVVFNYKGEDKSYFIFVKEGKNTNYIAQAKKQFYQELKSGQVAKTLKSTSVKGNRPWLIATASVLGAVAITFTSLFIWKVMDTVSPQPTGTHKVTWVDANDNVLEVDDVIDGEMPEYNGEKPASYDTDIDEFGEKYRYAFNGWDHELVPVTEDVTYKAVMKPHSLVTTIVLNTPEDNNSVYRYFSYVGDLEKVDWGDGTIDRNVAHAYNTPTSQKLTIRIYGEISQLYLAYDYVAFEGISACRGIESIHLSYSITSIPAISMIYVTSSSQSILQKIFIPSSVKYIADEAFSLTNGTIMNVEFEEGMELDYIGCYCFVSENPGSFVNFTFGKNIIIHDIYNNAFKSNCSSLDFPDGTQIDHISRNAFGSCPNITNVSFGNNCKVGDLYLDGQELNMPVNLEQLSFGNNCYIHALNPSSNYSSNSSLQSLSFGNNCHIETLGSFYSYESLKNIQFGKNSFVKNMNTDYMFSNCISLETAILPEAIGSELGVGTFNTCSSLKYISLPKNIKRIPEYFMQSVGPDFTSITIPRSIEYIGAYAFEYSFIREVIFEEGSCLKQIGSYAFESLSAEPTAFNIKLPEGIEVLQNSCFFNNQMFEIDEIIIPKSVKFIGAFAFGCCFDLFSFKFSEDSNLKSLGEKALEITGIKTLILPNKLEYIGYGLCDDCESLEYVKLPASVQYLGHGAFNDCVSLVTADLTALTDLPLTDADGESNAAIFNGCNQTKLTIYVSNQTVYDKLTSEEGKAAWGDFTVVMGEAPQPEI